jgi:hypothetical protein
MLHQVWVVAYFASFLVSKIYSDDKCWTVGKSIEAGVAEPSYYPGIYFPGGTEDYHEKSQSEQNTSVQRYRCGKQLGLRECNY